MILWRAGFRYLLRHPLQILFSLVGVALGVAVVTAIDLANSSADRAFRLSADALAGRATHQVVGGPNGLGEEFYAQIRRAGSWPQSAPVVEGYAAVPEQPGLTLRILGIDPFAEGPFRNYSPGIDGRTDVGRLLTAADTILLNQATAARLGLRVGDSLSLEIAGESRTVSLLGLLQPDDRVAAQAMEDLAVLDIAAAQELLGKIGRLSRIDLILPEGEPGARLLARLQAQLPPDAAIIQADSRQQSMAQMTRAFQLNLTALSLLALVVGMFLIYNTMTFSVLQRRHLLGALRTLGVTRRELFKLVLAEALLIGILGTLAGLVLGVLLADSLLALVTRTINDLYFVLNVRSLAITPLALGKGLLLGLGGTLAAAWMPALEAARAVPRTVLIRSSIETRQRRLLPWVFGSGALLIALGLCGLAVPSKSVALSFCLMFLLIVGYALLVPGAAVWLLKGLQPLLKRCFGILGKMAARNLVAGLSRTGIAAAALVIAVAATVGVGLMIDSFRVTVEQWLNSYLQADIYVTTADSGFGPGRSPLEPALLEAFAAVEGIAGITRAR
ncbi:MAG TPA: FtsX-like permease family protein, partial [Desulfuromonadales bacterium]|nr:FtsX-like permease family protein [Desulfuromonadales bacterium]